MSCLTASAALALAVEGEPAKVAEGRGVFRTYSCSACHGEEGRGGILNPNAIGGLVPPINRVSEGFTKAELREKVRRGVASPQKADSAGADTPLFMPAWEKVLSDKELESLIEYLFSLTPKGEGEEW
jgi:mono/diheme cytochrome c family protein